MVVFGQSDCIRAKVVVFRTRLFYSGKSGCTREKRLYLGKNGCIRSKSGCISVQKWL